jgi:hypothetical protein
VKRLEYETYLRVIVPDLKPAAIAGAQAQIAALTA